jgi:hypothetical protein
LQTLLAQLPHLAGLEICLGEDFTVHLHENLLDDLGADEGWRYDQPQCGDGGAEPVCVGHG